MPDGFDLASEIAAGVQDRHRAWTFIQEFARAWSTPLRDGDGYDGGELDAAEERLGFPFPAALREAYTLFGKRADLCATMHRLEPPGGLYVYEDTGLVMYHAENQGAWERYIRPADLHMDDPPTAHSCDRGHEEHATGVAWTERLSIALIDMVLEETLWGGAAQLSLRGELLEAEIPAVERQFVRLGFPQLPIEESPCTLGHRWYAGEDVLVCVQPYLPLTEEQEALRAPWGRPRSRAGFIVRGRTPKARCRRVQVPAR
ncbi:hypothetical protein [Actinomadura formosensis]|uniref:hypothetical protein n=1 Tax=Actinomadura formosensis TaxID=60706 RepID=UPI003D8F50CA